MRCLRTLIGFGPGTEPRDDMTELSSLDVAWESVAGAGNLQELVGGGRGLSIPPRTVNTAVAVEDGEGREKSKVQEGSRARGKAARVVASSSAKLIQPLERDCPARSELASRRLCLHS